MMIWCDMMMSGEINNMILGKCFTLNSLECCFTLQWVFYTCMSDNKMSFSARPLSQRRLSMLYIRSHVKNSTVIGRLESHLPRHSFRLAETTWYLDSPGWLPYSLHRDLRKLDIGLDNVAELAADRVLWRVLIHGATHHSAACYCWWCLYAL